MPAVWQIVPGIGGEEACGRPGRKTAERISEGVGPRGLRERRAGRGVERPADRQDAGEAGEAAQLNAIDLAAVAEGVIASHITAVVLRLIVVLISLLRSQAIRSKGEGADVQSVGCVLWRPEKGVGVYLLALNTIVEVIEAETQRMRGPRPGDIRADRVPYGPINILERRVRVASGRKIVVVAVAVEKLYTAIEHIVEFVGREPKGDRQSGVARELRKVRVDNGAPRGLIRPLPVRKDEELVLDDRAA